ncbi:hypothetical protein [Spiroplasma taiwanense]|uniref:Uncharacterized protein n=1 Tax=Spiroplasma taiwanense CT-1 TaxID=1276220 RepID=S5MGP4_9MOLU|nr:hypothetical protein [Spiroplasma taiwanense]AGR41020.1 hypothetical protein STAIW_v1c03620 [Spiroplasma taiwanense CT-1]
MSLIRKIYFLFRLAKKENRKDISRENFSNKLVHNQVIIDINVRTIRNSTKKFNSLIFKEKISSENGFRLIYTKGFNSFGFKEDVDLVFCDIHNQVIAIYSNFKPNKMTSFNQEARSIFVLANNTNKYLNIKKNDLLKIYK